MKAEDKKEPNPALVGVGFLWTDVGFQEGARRGRSGVNRRRRRCRRSE
jgi:hypothetical protein